MKLIPLIFCLTLNLFLFAQDKSTLIVELFTSEGCSSCPPADRLLSEIINEKYAQVEVLALSFHVDYWDYIGWKDPYASQTFTRRQRTYGRKFGLTSIYTPQMIVNGKYEFVGSSKSEWREALNYAKNDDMVALTIKVDSLTKEQIDVIVFSKEIISSLANVAIVERGLHQHVTRGENRGKKLQHDNVVRAFSSRNFDGKKNKFTLKLPQDLNRDQAYLIVYTQEQTTWHINGAKSLFLGSISSN